MRKLTKNNKRIIVVSLVILLILGIYLYIQYEEATWDIEADFDGTWTLDGNPAVTFTNGNCTWTNGIDSAEVIQPLVFGNLTIYPGYYIWHAYQNPYPWPWRGLTEVPPITVLINDTGSAWFWYGFPSSSTLSLTNETYSITLAKAIPVD